jgi:hypothetical protein
MEHYQGEGGAPDVKESLPFFKQSFSLKQVGQIMNEILQV